MKNEEIQQVTVEKTISVTREDNFGVQSGSKEVVSGTCINGVKEVLQRKIQPMMRKARQQDRDLR